MRAGVPGDYGVCSVVMHTTLPASATASGAVGAATFSTAGARPCSSACNTAVDLSVCLAGAAAGAAGGGGGVPLPPMLSMQALAAAVPGGGGLSSGLTAEGLPRARLGRTTTNASSLCHVSRSGITARECAAAPKRACACLPACRG